MAKPRRLNRAELKGLKVAQETFNATTQSMAEARLELLLIMKSLSLDPNVDYQIEDDGTVIQPEHGQVLGPVPMSHNPPDTEAEAT